MSGSPLSHEPREQSWSPAARGVHGEVFRGHLIRRNLDAPLRSRHRVGGRCGTPSPRSTFHGKAQLTPRPSTQGLPAEGPAPQRRGDSCSPDGRSAGSPDTGWEGNSMRPRQPNRRCRVILGRVLAHSRPRRPRRSRASFCRSRLVSRRCPAGTARDLEGPRRCRDPPFEIPDGLRPA